MNEILGMALALALGVSLGLIFFWGLWWTVQKATVFKRPELCFFCSFLLRTGIVLAGFYFIGNGHWQRMMVGLFGFILARIIVKKQTLWRESKQPPLGGGQP